MTTKGRYSRSERLERNDELLPGEGMPINCVCGRRIVRVEQYGYVERERRVSLRGLSDPGDPVRQFTGECACGQAFGLIVRPTHDTRTGEKLRDSLDVRYSQL